MFSGCLQIQDYESKPNVSYESLGKHLETPPRFGDSFEYVTTVLAPGIWSPGMFTSGHIGILHHDCEAVKPPLTKKLFFCLDLWSSIEGYCVLWFCNSHPLRLSPPTHWTSWRKAWKLHPCLCLITADPGRLAYTQHLGVESAAGCHSAVKAWGQRWRLLINHH